MTTIEQKKARHLALAQRRVLDLAGERLPIFDETVAALTPREKRAPDLFTVILAAAVLLIVGLLLWAIIR